MRALDYRIVDADNHYYEADDCFTRHIEFVKMDEQGPPMLKKLQGLTRLTPHKETWRFGTPDLRPLDQFRRNVWVAPYPEDDIEALVDLIGVGHVLGGSDYPHPEGLLHPHEFAEGLQRLSAADVRGIMRDNAAGLLKLG